MGWLDILKAASCTATFVFRGSFPSGASVAFGREPVKTATGMVPGRILSLGSIRSGVPDTVGGDPERPSLSLVLDNADSALNPWLTGTTGTILTEYRGDGFHNLTGRVYSVVFDRAAGVVLEEPVTPELVASGRIVVQDGVRVSLSFAAKQDVLGPVRIQPPTVRQLRDARVEPGAEGRYANTSGESGSLDSGTWGNLVFEHFRSAEDERVPFLYGGGPFRLIRVSEDGRTDKACFLAFVSFRLPVVDDVRRWTFWQIVDGERQPLFDSPDSVKDDITLETMPLHFTWDDGTESDLYVVAVEVSIGHKPNRAGDELDELWAIPPESNLLSGARLGGVPRSRPGDMVRTIVSDLSEAGSEGIDTASTDRINQVLKESATILIRVDEGEATVGELVAAVAEPYGLLPTLGTDGKLYLLSSGGLAPIDFEAAKTTLPHLREGVDLWTFEEEIPLAPPARGAPAVRVRIRWSREQETFWGDALVAAAPSAFTLDVRDEREVAVDGRCLNPAKAAIVLASASARRTYIGRRYRAHAPLWLAGMACGQLFRVSHTRALGEHGSRGASLRLARLEYKEVLPEEAGVLATFEDCGPLEMMRPVVLDTIENWLALGSTGTGVSLDVDAGSDLVHASAAVFSAGHLGLSLWTFGAADEGNRRSVRIVEILSGSTVRVSASYAAKETIAPAPWGTPTLDSTWCVMRNKTHPPAGRETRFCVCDEKAGEFSDGVAGYMLVTA